MISRSWPFTLALLLLFVLTGTLSASPGGGALFGGYWDSCAEYWESAFKRQDGVVIGVLGVGVVALLIITRSGKWQK